MKKLAFRVFLLFVSFFHLSFTLELEEEERSSNYELESHEYTSYEEVSVPEKATEWIKARTVPSFIINAILGFEASSPYLDQTPGFPEPLLHKYRKRYLTYGALIV